ncbi:MAG: carbonic anhydrase [Candidatus Thorarchaeota archaeon]
MLSDIEKLLMEGNFQFQNIIAQNQERSLIKKGYPKYPILFLTCMDPRINIYEIFQFKPGDVFILRNAGNMCTLDFMRSIVLTIYKYKVKYIIVLGHFDCGMTKLNMTDLRKEIPHDFFIQLSKRYSDFLSNIYEFFKPFNNEISNIIHQINNLQVITKFFPDVEVLGMVYDTQTGWVFHQDDFKELLIKKNQSEIYEKLLNEKSLALSKFLEVNKRYQVSEDKTEKIKLEKQELQEELNFIETETKNIMTPLTQKKPISKESDIPKIQIKMPKIQIPKIYIPKLKIHIPRSAKIKDD